MKRSMKKGLNSNQLKFIAIIAMTIDHLTWTLTPDLFEMTWWAILLHTIGRITAPIMWFFIAEGCYYTHDKKKYLTRLFGFAVISHFAYAFAFGKSFFGLQDGILNRTSIMWPLGIGAALIFLLKNDKISRIGKICSVAAGLLLAFPSDWSIVAVIVPALMYRHRGNLKKQALDIGFWSFIYAFVYFFCENQVYGILQMGTLLSLPLLKCYNGERGRWKGMKWFFYIYYPAHLVLIGFLRLYLAGH